MSAGVSTHEVPDQPAAVVVLSPDYADSVKFADEWLPAAPGTDGALAMAMRHVILKEFFVDRAAPRFVDDVTRFTDLPYLVTLVPGSGGAPRPGKLLTAADLGEADRQAAFRPVVSTPRRQPRAQRQFTHPTRVGLYVAGRSSWAWSTSPSSFQRARDPHHGPRRAAVRQASAERHLFEGNGDLERT